jgi:hypothetical protein
MGARLVRGIRDAFFCAKQALEHSTRELDEIDAANQGDHQVVWRMTG